MRAIADDAAAEAFAQALRRGPEVRDVAAWVWRAAYAIARGELQWRHRDPAGALRVGLHRATQRARALLTKGQD